MELAGYWDIDDPALHQRLAAGCGEGGKLLRGHRWALATAPSTLDDPDTVIPVLDDQGQTCGVVVGHLNPIAAQRLPASVGAAALTAEPGTGGAVTDLVWGSYVAAAVLGGSQEPRLVAGGDPVGLRSCFWTRHRGGIVFASRMADLVDLLGDQPGFDWDHLRAFLVHGERPTTTTGLTSIRLVRAGTRLDASHDGVREPVVWSPFAVADPAGEPPSPNGLRELIRRTVEAWAGTAESVYVELSGGLDSAVVAQALVSSGRRVVGGHFHHGASALADELAFARAVADRLGVELALIDVAEALPFTPIPDAGQRWDAPTGHLAWESLPAAHARVAAEHGCAVAMSGAGGDHVFVARTGAPFYLHDSLHRRGLRATWTDLITFSRVRGVPLARLLADLTRWETARRRGAPALLRRILGDEERPAWLRSAVPAAPESVLDLVPPSTGLPAGKMGQVLEMVLLGCTVGTRHAGAAPDRTRFPLLSQPLVELGLRTGLDAFINATTDRILLREAMYGRLPAELLARRSKGEHTATWQRGLRANLTLARELIADGACAAVGLIDPAPAQAAVTAAALGHTGRLWPLVNLLSVELWIRSWTTRRPSPGDRAGHER